VNRSLTTADLNVADTDNGACGLHAALPGGSRLYVSPPVAPGSGGATVGSQNTARPLNDAPDFPAGMLDMQGPLGVLPQGGSSSDGIPRPAPSLAESMGRAEAVVPEASLAHRSSWDDTVTVGGVPAVKQAARDASFALGKDSLVEL
jgi:hypothetical protein